MHVELLQYLLFDNQYVCCSVAFDQPVVSGIVRAGLRVDACHSLVRVGTGTG
jgi:hypothetical protein